MASSSDPAPHVAYGHVLPSTSEPPAELSLGSHPRQMPEDDGNIAIAAEKLAANDDPNSKRVKFTRMHRRWLSTQVLDKYNIKYIIDSDPDYLVIQRWVPEYEQDFLWAATRAFREEREAAAMRLSFLQNQASPFPATGEPQVFTATRATRGYELDLEINRVPFEIWLRPEGRRSRGKHVLDVAMKPVYSTQSASHTADETASIPVRLAINSKHLCSELEKITGQWIRDTRYVLLPPWKSLITYRDDIKERLRKLERIQCDRDSKIKRDEKIGEQMEGEVVEALKEPCSDQYTESNVDIPQASTSCEVCGMGYPPHETPLECLDLRVSHLLCLVNFLDTDLKRIFDLREELAVGKTREIAFDDLWHLFNPGDVIVASDPRQAFRVFHTSGGRACLSKVRVFEKTPVVTPFTIDCFYIDFDSKNLGPVHTTFTISEYAGARPVISLPTFPVRFLENPDDVVASLIKRGKKLLGLSPFSHKKYRGPSFGNNIYSNFQNSTSRLERHRRPLNLIGKPIYVNSDIIIDFEDGLKLNETANFEDIGADRRETAEGCEHYGYSNNLPNNIEFSSGCACSEIVKDHIIDDDRATRYKGDLHLLGRRRVDEGITDDHLMLLPGLVCAFVLRENSSFMVLVDLIQDIGDKNEDCSNSVKNSSGLRDLILPEGHADLLESLVKIHKSTGKLNEKDQRVQRDQLSGRRNGLIILLHGDAGLGKTATAERIASYLCRPLYPLTYSEIRPFPDGARRDLTSYFNSAQNWNCIAVLEGVDLLLSKSNEEPGIVALEREQILSAFCDLIDSYPGILILITKSTGNIDERVLSRIHVALRYQAFDENAAMRVWQMNINRVRDNGLLVLESEVERGILKFAKDEYGRGKRWNGTQIQNYFQIAMSLAEYEAEQELMLAIEHGTKEMGSKPDPPRLRLQMLKTVASATGNLVVEISN